MVQSENKKDLSIYIHIPFCVKKCLYCDFLSFTGNEKTFNKYADALVSEIEKFDDKKAEIYVVKSVFVGGGTPSVVPPEILGRVFYALKQKFVFSDIAEITVEANPATFSEEKLIYYKNIGINRISIGLQSWQDDMLKKLGRIHSKDDFIVSYEMARKAGFDNINVDIMFALPGQTVEMWSETVRNVVSLQPEHISAYSLIIEPETPFYEMWQNKKISTVSDEDDRKMYWFAIDYFQKNGYFQYEISNFAKNNFESKHNIVYWTRKNYVGFGLGAHSFIDNERFCNVYDFVQYTSGITLKASEKIDESGRYSEFMFLGLRMTKGISAKHFYECFGQNIFDIFGEQIETAQKNGLLVCEGDCIRLTRRGIDLSNIVFREFV